MTLSIILVNYNSHEDLARCLPTLFGEEQDAEVLVVDNSPGNDTAEWLAATYPQVRLIVNPINTGYAGGNNLGIEHATGDWVLILNPDTELHPGAIDALLSAARQHPNSLITPKILNSDGTVNACGLEMHYTGITSCRGLGDESERYAGIFSVPLVSGAAFLAPKWLLTDLDGFDARYFMYLEDADLSLRARANGYAIHCVADAVVKHAYTATMSPSKFYYLERNRLLTLFRLYQTRTLYRIAGALLLTEFATWAYALLKGPRYLSRKGASYLWLWRNRGEWLAARHAFQHTRKISDDALLEEGTTALPFDQLVASKQLANLLGRITQPLYALLRPSGSITRARA